MYFCMSRVHICLFNKACVSTCSILSSTTSQTLTFGIKLCREEEERSERLKNKIQTYHRNSRRKRNHSTSFIQCRPVTKQHWKNWTLRCSIFRVPRGGNSLGKCSSRCIWIYTKLKRKHSPLCSPSHTHTWKVPLEESAASRLIQNEPEYDKISKSKIKQLLVSELV